MSETTAVGSRLTLDLWHPNCWALEATTEASGGILTHAIYDAPQACASDCDTVNGLFTAYGDSTDAVETLLDHVRSSRLTGTVQELQERFGGAQTAAPGPVVREFVLEYDPTDMICNSLLEQGFVHSAAVRIEGGREYWPVCYMGDRRDIEPRLDVIRQENDADVVVSSITSTNTAPSTRPRPANGLTASQRTAFELARENGYYRWPRETTTRELAVELGISKTTLLEHLRKAEAKLLDP